MKFLKISFLGLLMILFSVNLYSQNVGTGSISGMVVSETDNLPIVKAKVYAFKTQGMIMVNMYHAETDADGKYKVDNLQQGQYRLYVQANSFVSEFYEDVHNPLYANTVTVGSGADVTDIDFYLEVGGIISGVVVDSTGTGIPNVFVAATPYDLFPLPVWADSLLLWGGDFTDENGNYKISTLDSGEYRVAATLDVNTFPFFELKYYDNKDNYSDADPVVVDNGQEVTGIDFQFDYTLPTGGIAGNISDADGNPLKGIYVFAWQHTAGDTFYGKFRGWRNFIKTDENGDYAIKHLTPGDYIVSATRMEWWNYQTLYYDNVSSYDDATPVTVTDMITTKIDFKFDQAADLGSISGKVVSDADGSPVANAFVEAMWIGSYAGHGGMCFRPSLFAWTDVNGEYKIDMVQEGKYIVLVHKNGYTEFYDDTQDIEKATEVDVTAGQETTGIDFSIPATPDTGSKVSGIVTDDSTGNPIEGAIVTLFPVMDSPCGGAFKGKFTLFDFYTTVSDAKGEYMIAGIPEGKYIAVCWASGHIVEFYNDKLTPWDADRIELDGSEEKAGIDFALTPGWGFRFHGPGDDLALGSISGQVMDNEGRYIDGAYISIIDENYQVRATEKTGPDGRYTLGSVPAGDYFIKVDRMPYSTAYYGNVTDLNSATPITVGEAANFAVTGVDVQLIPMSATAIGEQGKVSGMPAKFELSQNYPNPFNPTTTIRYALPKASHVTLKMFNLRGELVKTLVNGYQSAQYHQVMWNGSNEAGEKVAAGIYLYQLKAENYKQTMRLILLK